MKTIDRFALWYMQEASDFITYVEKQILLQFMYWKKTNNGTTMQFANFQNDMRQPITFGQLVVVNEFNSWLESEVK